MADEQIVTSIVAKADLSSLVAEVHKATASLQNLQQELSSAGKIVSSQVKVINNSFGETLRSTGQFSSHFVTLHSDVEKFGKGLDSGRLKLRDYYGAFQQHAKTSSGLIRDLAKQQVTLQNAVMQPLGRNAQGLMQYSVHIPRGLDLVKNKTNIARMELQIMNRAINEGATALINWGKNTQWAGRQLTVGLTVPIAAFGAAAAKAFREADQELTRLSKVYGDIGGATTEQLTQIRRDVAATARELSSAMGVNFQETIALAADIAATGKTGNELLASVSETTRLAVLGEVDRQEAMKATLAIQTAFKQNTEELSESINFLNAVENQTSTTLNDLVEAIPKAGPVIKQLGGSVEELALYLTAMREGGINASESANALKSGLASLINPTKQTVGVMSDFGIDILGMVQKNAGNTTSLLLDLQGALNQLDPLNKAQAIEQLFGKFQFARISALLNNLGVQGSQTLQVLDLMKASATELEQVAARELTAVTESAAGQYKRAIEGLKAELASVGEDFLEIGTKVINVATKVLKFLNELPEPVKKLITAFGGLTAVAGPMIMLTGVLANFAGYLLKGATNLKMLLSGNKGWRMLTPEIVAADHAARNLSETFYSDAQAAAVLEQALRNLIDEFRVLQNAVNAGQISVAPAISTMAGSLIMPGGYRSVDPNNPLVGAEGTRAMSHINPRKSGFAGQLLGVVPGPIPVNRKIGATPQIYMTERLPDIEGLTSVSGVSTGIVAQEAAKFHALMATLGMQTKAEVAELKKVISLGGTVSSDLLNTYDDLLPITAKFATKASNESALIVAELRAAKISVEEAKLRIMTLNAQIEAEMASEIAQFAALRGRTIDFSKAPLLDQPVVDAAGNYTLRDLYKRESTRSVLEEFGRLRGIRSFGAPYGIETTRIPKLNKGGDVYFNNGDQVPGPNINADIVPAMLTPGEFVIRRDVAQQDPDGMRALNEGRAYVVPFQANTGGMVPRYLVGGGVRYLAPALRRLLAQGDRSGYRAMLPDVASSRANRSGYDRDLATIGSFGPRRWMTRGAGTASAIDAYIAGLPARNRVAAARVIEDYGSSITRRSSRDAFSIEHGHLEAGGALDKALKAAGLPALRLEQRYHATHLTRASVRGGRRFVSGYTVTYDARSNLQANQGTLRVSDFLSRNMKRTGKYDKLLRAAGIDPRRWRSVEREIDRNISAYLAPNKNARIGDETGDILFESFIPIIDSTIVRAGGSSKALNALKQNKFERVRRNRGGMIPGYIRGGGVVRRNRRFYGERQTPLRSTVDIAMERARSYGASSGPGVAVPAATLTDRLRMSGFLPGASSMPLNIDPTTREVLPGPAPRTMSSGKMMGLSIGGSMLGGTLGSSMGMMGSMVLGTVGMMLPQMIMGLKNAGSSAAILGKILKSLTIPGLILTVLGTGIKLLLDYKKRAEDAGKANRLAFGGTEESFASVGIKNFKAMSDRIKDINEELELHKAQVRSTFESYTRTGTPGLTLTIQELKEAIKNAKESQKDYVEAFNNIDSSRVVDYAASIKAQFVAMGMSAQEATNQIYAIIRASEKAGQALAAITSKDFTSISDTVSAINMLIKGLKKELESEDFNAEEFNRGLDTLLNSVIIYKDALIGTKDENQNIIDQADALSITMEKISATKGAQKEISEENLEALKNENIIYQSILGAAETIESIAAKILLYNAGFGEVVNLAKMGADEAARFAKNLADVQNAMNAVTEDVTAESRNPLLPLANIIDRVNKESARATDAVKKLKKVDEEYYKNKIDSIQKVIKALQKEREARLKALDIQEESQSYETALSQAQIRYKQAVATGDLALAAQEQLSIEQLVADRQRQLTRDQINNTYDAKIAKLEERIERLQDELKKQQDSYNAKTAAATQKAADLAQLQSYRDRIEEIALRNFGKSVMSKTDAQELSNIFEEMIKAGGDIAQAANDMRKNYGVGSSVYQMGWQQSLVNALNNQVGGNAEFRTAVDEFALAVAEFRGKTGGQFDSSKIKTSPAGSKPGAGVILSANVSDLESARIKVEKGTVFPASNGNRYEITQVSGKTAYLKRRQMGGPFAAGDKMLVGERGPEVVEFNKSGKVYPNPATYSGGMPNPFAMGMDWFGKTLIKGARSLVKEFSGIDPMNIFGKKSKMDMLSMATMMLPMGGGVKLGSKSVSPLVAQMMAHGAKWGPEGRAFQMAAIDKEAAENLFKMDLSKINLPDSLPSVNMTNAKGAIANRLSGNIKGGIESFHAGDWEVVQALRVMELLKKYPKADLSNIQTFNQLYGKEFYGLVGDPVVKLFKGVRSLDPAKSFSGGWRTSGGLPTYFSTNPYIAAVYSLMLGKRTPENLPMFAAQLPMSKLPGFFGEGAIRGSQAQGSMEFPMSLPNSLMSEIASSIKEYSLPGAIMGNWLNVIKDGSLQAKNLWPRFHDWNGTVPGPYGQEVGAILKAGTEGVYDTDYINSLKNGTMNTASTSNVISITNEYNIPQSFTKEEVGKYIIDLQMKQISKLGPSRSH